MEVIEITFDAQGGSLGQSPVYHARLKSNPGIRDSGGTRNDAIRKFLITAKTFGMSDNEGDYKIEDK